MGKRAMTAVLCMSMLWTLCSCNTVTGIIDRLGFDTYDYMSETIHTTHEPDSKLASELAGMIRMLTPSLTEFDTMLEAIPAYRDAVLSYMLESEYARYSGNMELIEEAAKAYPEYQVTQIIPASDFESTMYRYFGGTVKISHKDGIRFRYLKKVEAYISPSAQVQNTGNVNILTLSETDKTYQVTFTVSQGDTVSPEYFVLIIKREDGTLYFKKLKKVEQPETDTETTGQTTEA